MERLGAKVTVVGVGAAGSSIAFALASGGLATEIALIDADQSRVRGEASDLDDAAAFIKPVHIYAADYPDAVGSRVVVFSASAPRRPGVKAIEAAAGNIEVLKESFPRVLRYCPQAVFIIVTSPVDILTYAATLLADIGDERIMGCGTVLGTSRFKRLLARHVRVDPRNVHAYVVGEHGRAEVPLWSRASVAGFHIDEFCRLQELPAPDRAAIHERMIGAAAETASGEGITHFAASIAVARVVEAVLRDERSVLTVSGMVEGLYGLEGPNCFSLPAVVGSTGRRRPIPLAMDGEEMRRLREAAERLKGMHRELGLH